MIADLLVLTAYLGYWSCVGLLTWGVYREAQRGVRGWRVRRELTRVMREKDREQLEWRRGF
jgi:hypothetical protein